MSRLPFHCQARTVRLYMVMLFLVFLTLLSGCAFNISLKKDFTSGRTIILHRPHTPPVSYYVEDVMSGTFLDIFLIIPQFAIIADRIERNKALSGMKFPDVGELVVQKFTEKVAENGEGWPRIVDIPGALENPVSEEQFSMEIWVKGNHIAYHPGYKVTVQARMFNQDVKTIYRITIIYESRKYERHRTFEEYIAEDGKLLAEEIRYASDMIADELFENLRSDLEKRVWKRTN